MAVLTYHEREDLKCAEILYGDLCERYKQRLHMYQKFINVCRTQYK